MKAFCALLALCLLAASADARPGRTLLKGGPSGSGSGSGSPGGSGSPSPSGGSTTTTTTTTAPKLSPPPPPSPPPPANSGTTTTTAAKSPPPPASSGTTTTSGGGSTVFTAAPAGSTAGKWNYLVSLAGDKCTLAQPGKPIFVNGYPSSPFDTTKLVFTKPYRKLTTLENSLSPTPCDQEGRCMYGFDININQTWYDFGLSADTQCQKIPVLAYNNVVPGPIMYSQTGVQDVVRFTNNIQDNPYFGPAGPGMNGGPGEKDLCANRMVRYQQRNVTGEKMVSTRGYGRATVIHHHGQASVSSMDGWAEQFFCRGETKDYILPNNRHATLFYHDHSVGITSENVYAGMAGMRITRPCPEDDPYWVEKNVAMGKPGVPEWPLIIQDIVVDTQTSAEQKQGICRLKYDRLGVHHDQLWGDINLINGQPWPVLNTTASWQRFRVLNASPSRARILTFRNDMGVEIGSNVCHIIGSDGGTLPDAMNHRMPPNGLLTDVAYRWDIICDFSAYNQSTIYLVNEHQPARTTSETPYFCYSHLLMKINVGLPDSGAQIPRLNATRAMGTEQQDAFLPPELFANLTARALAGESDRSLKFGKSSGMWLLNDRGWDHADTLGKGKHIEFDNVGQNTIELWTLEAGGGWIHPVHIHLVDFFCVAWQGANWDGSASSGGGWQPCPRELRNAPKDVMHIGADVGKITLAARYGPELGEYMMHCHNNVHEDNDMFRAFMIRDAMGSLTFSKTPAFNYTSLQESPLTYTDRWGDDRNTTYGSPETVAAPPLTSYYGRELLKREYYRVFYPPKGDYLDDPSHNFWLTTCGRGTYNGDPVIGK